MSGEKEDVESQHQFPQQHEGKSAAAAGPEVIAPGPSTATTLGPGVAEPIYPGGKSINYTSFVRFCMYIFFIFYLIFALLILFSGRADLTHKEHLLSEVVHLDTEEITIQRMFIMNALFLSVAATIGLFAFYYHKYSLFLSFSVGLLFTMVFGMVSLKYTFTAYNQMGKMLDNHTAVSAVFDAQLMHYDWRNYKNASSIFINKFQNEFQCCGGSKGYHDWVLNKPNDVPAGAFPITCCALHFDDEMELLWCPYQDVETKRSCPTAFTAHLMAVQNSLKTQVMLLFEICLTQVLTVAVFFFLICRGERMFTGSKH